MKRPIPIFISILIFLSWAGTIWGQEFCVDNPTQFQIALTSAETNGEDDIVKVLEGVYSGNFEYDSSEGKSITLAGGYTSCSDSNPMPNPSTTILDGLGSGIVLLLTVRTSGAHIVVEGFTIKNAHYDNYASHIVARIFPSTGSSGNITITNNIFTEILGEAVDARSSSSGGPSGNIVFTGNTFTGSPNEGSFMKITAVSSSPEYSSGNVEFTNNVVEGGLQPKIVAESISDTSSSGDIIFRDNRIKGIGPPGPIPDWSAANDGLVNGKSKSNSGSAGNLLFINNKVTESFEQGIRALSISISGPSGRIELTDNIISDNANAGALCSTQSQSNAGGSIVVKGNTVNNNGSNRLHDGVMLIGESGTNTVGEITVTGNTINGNLGSGAVITIRGHSTTQMPGPVILSENVITQNGWRGVMVHSVPGDGLGANIIVKNNTVSENNHGGIEAISKPRSTDIHSGDILFTDNIITNNHFSSFEQGYGAGIYAATARHNLGPGLAGNITFINNIISGNTTNMNSAGCGGGVYAYCSSNSSDFPSGHILFINNLISQNSTYGYLHGSGGVGGGVFALSSPNGKITFTNNTVTENSSQNRGAGIYVTEITEADSWELNIYNTILWGNTGSEDIFFPPFATQRTANGYNNDYASMYGSWTNSGNNINADPHFLKDGDYHLKTDSSCIDAGDNNAPNMPQTDIEGKIRVWDGNNDSVAVVDIGAYENQPNDSDGDGLIDSIENTTCTDPNNADTDNDGIIDGVEDANLNGILDPGETDPCNLDSDGDGIQAGTELGYTLNDIVADTDTSVFQPDFDPNTTTDPLNKDTDGDDLNDGTEDLNHNGRVDQGETNPNQHKIKAMPWIPLLLLDE